MTNLELTEWYGALRQLSKICTNNICPNTIDNRIRRKLDTSILGLGNAASDYRVCAFLNSCCYLDVETSWTGSQGRCSYGRLDA